MAQNDHVTVRASRSRTDTVLLWAIGAAVTGVVTLLAYVVYSGALSAQPPHTYFEREAAMTKLAVEQSPDDAAAWQSYITVLIVAEDYDTAATEIDRAMEATDGDSRIMLTQARLLAAQGETEAAIEQAKKAQVAEEERIIAYVTQLAQEKNIVVQPDTVDQTTRIETLTFQGVLNTKLERWDEALAAYSAALESNPNLLDVLTSRGYVYLELGKPEEAVADFESALRFDAENELAKKGIDMANEVKQ